MTDILLCGDFDAAEEADWTRALRDAMPQARWLNREQALRTPSTVEFAVVANPPPGSLSGLPRLQLIQSLWAGVDRLLDDRSLPPGVPIARMVDPAMTLAMAETAQWATLALHRGFFANARDQRQRVWRQQVQRRADDLCVGVLGSGEMGRVVAQRLAAQGYRVSTWSLRPNAAPLAEVPGRHGADALHCWLPSLQIVINLLPLTATTRGLLNAEFFATLPPAASVVNLARGAHVVDAVLLAALDNGHLQHAVLDVFHDEPLPVGHAYWTHPAVTVLPHVAAQTDPRSAAQVVAANIDAALNGRPVAHRVDRARGY